MDLNNCITFRNDERLHQNLPLQTPEKVHVADVGRQTVPW